MQTDSCALSKIQLEVWAINLYELTELKMMKIESECVACAHWNQVLIGNLGFPTKRPLTLNAKKE